ncbi:hypothetical protein C0989_004337 [Termitomyces sp. Mn162]|nr:hypothetical protein C0989_004337 [Termitomyces sp. Mn162]
MSFTLNVPIIQENDQLLPSPPELVSPRRSASLYVPSTSQFPPIFSARSTSSFHTSIPQISENYTSSRALDSVGEDKLASPDFTSPTGPPQQSIDSACVDTELSGPGTAPVAYPVARILDWALRGKEHNTYKEEELKSTLQFHCTGEEPLRDNEIAIINGVLELNTRKVESVMIPMTVSIAWSLLN